MQTQKKEYLDVVDKLDSHKYLKSWVQTQHLERQAIQGYHAEFTSHPANVIVLKQFLHETIAGDLSNFVNQEAEFETVFGLYSTMEKDPTNNAAVTEAEWLKAEEDDQFFRLRKFMRVSPEKMLTPSLARYLSFLSAFKGHSFKKYFEDITGLNINLDKETYNFFYYKKGDFLKSHTDRGDDYLLAFMLYLTPEWETHFGGLLNIVLPNSEIMRIEPEYNSLVLFNVNRQAEHFVSLINDCVGEYGRSAFSGWLHKAPNSL